MKQRWLILIAMTFVLRAGTSAMAQAAAEEHHDTQSHAPSTNLVITAGTKSTTLTMADLQAMPKHTLKVHNGHSSQDETYVGASLADLLAKYGITLEGSGAKKLYHTYVKAEGTDKYWVLYSASELEPTLATWDSIVAYQLDDHPLGADGAFKIVAGGERKPARWVRNLSSLTVVTVPD